MSGNAIVSLNISRDTAVLSQASFGVVNILGENLTGTSRIQYFSTEDLAPLAAALTGGSGAVEYIAAQSIAAQPLKPALFAVSRIEEEETVTEALDAIKLVDNDWYGLTLTDRTKANVLLALAWAEANEKLFWSASADTRITTVDYATDDGTDAVEDSAVAIGKANNYSRSFILQHPDAGTTYPEVGFLSSLLTRKPGSYSGFLKTIVGSPFVNLTPTQAKNARDKSCNIFQRIGGLNVVRDGVACSGEFFDVMHFVDWFGSEMAIAVYGLLARNTKIPYSPEGLVAIQSVMDKVGQSGIDSGGFTKTRFDENKEQIGGYRTIMPSFDSIPVNNRAARRLTNVRFKGFLAGAIHYVEINGNITL